MLELKGYNYRVEVRFNLTIKALKRFRFCSQHHYDGLCKSVSRPGPGSFLHGWTNIWPIDTDWENLPDDQTQEVHLSLDNLDILGKICEQEHTLIQVGAVDKDFRVAPLVWDLLKKGIEESKRVNPRESIEPMKVIHVTGGVPR